MLEAAYPGRGIVVGVVGDATVHAYWVMGRSPNSKNRRLVSERGRVFTDVADKSQSHESTWTIYTALQRAGAYTVVANGDHGDVVASRVGEGTAPALAFDDVIREQDAPLFTPRITAISSGRQLWLSKISAWRAVYEIVDPSDGTGYGITTYTGDDAAPAANASDPFTMPITADADVLCERVWTTLNPDYRVAAAVWTVRGDAVHESIVNAL